MTTTWARALTIATLVPGLSWRKLAACTCGVRTRSMRRGSTTISCAPSRNRRFIREANTGWASVGLAPTSSITSDCSTDLKSCVPAEVPNVLLSPNPVGEWQTRAQVSMLLLAKAVRTKRWTTNTSSLVQRDDEMPPIELMPWRCWMSRNRSAAYVIASSHDTTRHSSSIDSRTIGSSTRSLCVAYPQANRPLTHECPSLAPPFLYGVMRTTVSPCISALNEHPTPQ